MEVIFGLVGMAAPLLQADSHNMEGRKQHKQALALDLELARRDMLNQLREQRESKLENLLVMDTLMLGVCFSIMVEGNPPDETGEGWLVLFAVFLGLSMCLFFLSIWFLFKIHDRMSRYNVLNPNHKYMLCGHVHASFGSFFECHCNNLKHLGIAAYYLGMCCLMFTGCIIMITRFDLQFSNASNVPGIVFCCICGVTALFSLVLPWVFPTGPKIDDEFERDQFISLANQRHLAGHTAENEGFGEALELSKEKSIQKGGRLY